jgi:hypothetical protein
MPKMNPEIKAKWLVDLKSGEYKKGTGFLRSSDDKFCCLGVLCDRYQKETGLGKWDFYSVSSKKFCTIPRYFTVTALPDEVMEWAGLRGANPVIPTNKFTPEGYTITTLAEINDYTDTFDEVITAIEEYL